MQNTYFKMPTTAVTIPRPMLLKVCASLILLCVLLPLNGQICDNATLEFSTNFDNRVGEKIYSVNDLRQDFGRAEGLTAPIRGMTGTGTNWPHKTRVIDGVLRAEYVKNDASGRAGGFLFDRPFTNSDEGILEYRVRFDENFVWSDGGKLPGLGGGNRRGSIPSGCTRTQNSIDNGFSSRLMWRNNGSSTETARLVVYNYFPDRDPDVNRCGVDMQIARGIEKNRWYTIRQYIRLNTPGRKNGLLKVWLDGVLKVDRDDIFYRKAGKSSVRLNAVVAHTYRGGARTDTRWHSPTTDYAYFDDFKVWRGCDGIVDNSPNSLPSVNLTRVGGGDNRVSRGYRLQLRADANDSDGEISQVQLYRDNTLIRTERVKPYDWGHSRSPNTDELNGLPPGTYRFRAVATDDRGATSESVFELTVVGRRSGSLDDVVRYDKSVINRFVAFPNPVNDEINVAGTPEGAFSLEVIDLQGRQVMSQRFPARTTKARLAAASLRSGTYLIRLKSDEGSFTRRFVKR